MQRQPLPCLQEGAVTPEGGIRPPSDPRARSQTTAEVAATIVKTDMRCDPAGGGNT
jgi:hypothetical protein